MKIGKLKYPIDIEKYTSVQNPNTGSVTESWVYFDKVWAGVRGITGREFLAASAEQSATTFQVTIRYRDDLDTSYRFNDNGTILNIKAMLPDEDKRFLTCMCEVLG